MGMPAATMSASLLCSFGMAPSTLNVIPTSRVLIEGKPAATIADMAPIVNMPPFGMCMSLTNPTVAAATAAALGVLTPMPCVPAPLGPWKPGAATPTIATGTSLMTAVWPMAAAGSPNRRCAKPLCPPRGRACAR